MRSYEEKYQQFLSRAVFRKKEYDQRYTGQLLKLAQAFPEPSVNSGAAYFALDYTTRRYIAITKSIVTILERKPDEYLEGGLDFNLHCMHQDDVKVFSDQVFPEILRMLQNVPPSMRGTIVSKLNFRLRHRDGHYVQGLQCARYITDEETGRPLCCYGSWSDISLYKKDSSIICRIEQVTNDTCETLSTLYYYPETGTPPLTRREREIIGWLAEGWSTKQIAARLHLTESTITNHRVNMLRKTNTVNIAQLVAYAVRQGII